jgi:hypothetical protein
MIKKKSIREPLEVFQNLVKKNFGRFSVPFNFQTSMSSSKLTQK